MPDYEQVDKAIDALDGALDLTRPGHPSPTGPTPEITRAFTEESIRDDHNGG